MPGKAATLRILGNNLDAKEKLKQIREEADRLRADNPELTVKINRAQARAEMAVLRDQLKVEADKPITQKVKVAFEKVDFAKMGSAALWGAGIAAAAGPGIGAVGLLSAGLLGVTAAVTPAIAGLGLFGAVVKSGMTQVETANAANKRLTGGLGELQSSVKTASASWSKFTGDALKGGAAATMAHAIGLIPIALKAVTPLLAPTEKALDGIIGRLGKGLQSNGFSRFIGMLSKNAGPSITKLADIFGHLGSIAGKTFIMFQGLGQKALTSIDNLLSKADSGTNSGLTKFLNWVHTNGPQIMGILKNLGTTLGNTAKAFAGIGAMNLGAFTVITNFLATVSRTKIGAGALIGLLVLTKVGGAVGPLIQLVRGFKLLAGALGLARLASISFMGVPIVAVIGLIIGVTILLVTHWNTVKKVAGVVWHAVLNFIKVAFNWVKKNWPLLLGILLGPVATATVLIIQHWHQIESGAKSLLGKLIGFFKSLPGKIVGALGDLGHLLLHAGASIIHGLISGIENAIPGLHTALGWVTSIIPSWKGPPEKDARLLRPAGRSIIGGLIGGLRDGVPDLHAQLTRTTNVIANTRVPALAASGGNGRITAEWVGGSGADREFLTWLKKNIRLNGGDPGVIGR